MEQFGGPCRPLIADNEQACGSWEQAAVCARARAFPGHARQLFVVKLLPVEQALLNTQVCLTGLRTH